MATEPMTARDRANERLDAAQPALRFGPASGPSPAIKRGRVAGPLVAAVQANDPLVVRELRTSSAVKIVTETLKSA